MGKKNKKKEKEISKKNKVIGINQETCEEKLFLKKRKMKKKDKTVKDVQVKKTEYEEMVINTGKRKCSEMESEWKASTGDDIYQNQGQKKIKMSFDDTRKTILLTNSNRINNTKVRNTDEEMKRFDAEENLTDSFVGVSKLQDKNDEVLKISKSTRSFLKQGKGKSPDIVTKRMNNYKDSYEYAESDGSKKKKGQMVKVKDKYRSDRRIFKVRGSRSDKKYDKFDTATEKVKEKNRKDEMDEDTCIKKKYFIDEESCYDKRTRKVQGQESEVKKNDISSRYSHRNIRNYHNRNIEHSEVDQIIGLHKMRPESDPGGMVKKNSESTQISTKKNESNRELNCCKSDGTMSPRKSRSDNRLKCKEKKKTKKHREKHKKENTKLEEKQSKKEKYDKTKPRTEEKQETKSSKILEGESEGKVMSGKIKKEKNKKDQIEKSRRKMKMDRYDNSDKDDKYLVKSDKVCGDFNVVGMSSGGFKTKETDNNTECKGNKKLKSVIEITYEKDDGKYLKMETTQGKNNRKYKQEYYCNKEVKQMIKTGRNKIIESNDDDDDDSSFYKNPKLFVIKQGNDVTLSAKDTGTTLHEENNQMKKHYTNTADSDYKLKERENKWNVSEKQCSLHNDNKESIIVPKCESRKCAEKFADDTTYRDQQNHLKVKQHEENVDLHRNKTDVTMETDSLILGKPEDTSHFMMSGDDILLENYTKYDNKCTREVQMEEISIKKKGTTHVSVNDRAEIQNNDEVSQNVHSSKINEEKCKCEGERSAKSSGNYHECVKNDDIISFCDCGSIVHASEEFKTICLQRHKDVLNKVQDMYNDEKKENSVKNLKEILKESKNKESKNGKRKEGGGSVKENYFLQKDSCDSDLKTGGVENKSIDEKTKKVKSVISLVSIPVTISGIPSSADDKIKADFEDKMSSRFCRSQSVRKIMHEELINMKRTLDLGFENSREDKIKSNIEETVLKKHENVDFKSICEDLSNEEMDTGKKLDSKRRGNDSVKCDEHEHISEKISDIDGVHDVTTMKDESKLEHTKPKEGNSLFNIDIDNIIKRVSKKDDIFKRKKKQRKQNKNYERTSEPGSKTFQSLESSDESTSSAKEEIEGKRLESVETSISRECKSSTIDSRDKYETDYTLNSGDEMMKSSTQLKEIEIRKSTKKRRKQGDCNDDHLEKKNRRKLKNVEKRRKTRSKSFDKNEGDEISSRDQYYKKRYSKDGEFSKNGDVSENMAKENKSNKFKLGGMYFDRMEECNQYDKTKSGSPMRVEGNKNTNALYTPDINKDMSIRSAQDADNREKEFSIPVRNQHPSHSYLNRYVKHHYSSSMYPVYSDNHDRYPYSRANKIFDDQSSTSSSSNFNRSYDYSSPFMFDTKYFNSLNERSSNGGLNSTISSTPDRPRFRIPSYKELTGRENEVEEDYSNDKKEDFELFWRIQSPFSQFHPAKFEVHGLWYNCAEQFFMHQKALTFNDKEIAAAIMNTAVPREQKSLGRKIVNFCPKIWFAKAISVAKEGNIAKFSQNEHLKKQLFNTYPKILAEASPVDNTWGIGLAKDNQLAWSRKTWRGQNFLGYTLTDVRNELMRKEGLIPVEKGGTNSDEKEGANSDEKGGENS